MNKKEKIIYARCDNDYWKTVKGRKAIQGKIYWYNGEHHVTGKWKDTGEKFDLPYIFFVDKKIDL